MGMSRNLIFNIVDVYGKAEVAKFAAESCRVERKVIDLVPWRGRYVLLRRRANW